MTDRDTDPIDGGVMFAAMSELLSLQAVRSLDPVTVDWWRAHIDTYVRSTDVDLGECLNFGKESRNEMRMAIRNKNLRDAWHALDCASSSDKERGKKLANEIKRFETRWWPRAEGFSEPDPSFYTVRTYIWRARMFGPLPGHWRRLRDICCV